MKIEIIYPNNKSEIICNVISFDEAIKLRFHKAGADICGIIAICKNGGFHRFDFQDIKSFKISA